MKKIDSRFESFYKLSIKEINELLISDQIGHELLGNGKEVANIWYDFLKRDFDIQKEIIPAKTLIHENNSMLSKFFSIPYHNPKILRKIYTQFYKLKLLHGKMIDDLFDNVDKLETQSLLLICVTDLEDSDLSSFPENKEENYKRLSLYFELSLYLGCINIPKLFIQKYSNIFITKEWLDKTAKAGNFEIVKCLLYFTEFLRDKTDSIITSSLVSGVSASFILAIGTYLNCNDSVVVDASTLVFVAMFMSILNMEKSSHLLKPDNTTLECAISSENHEIIKFLLDPSYNFGLSAVEEFNKSDSASLLEYDLCLMEKIEYDFTIIENGKKFPDILKPRVLYIRQERNSFLYAVITPYGVSVRDKVLNGITPSQSTVVNLYLRKTEILKIIFEAEHAQNFPKDLKQNVLYIRQEGNKFLYAVMTPIGIPVRDQILNGITPSQLPLQHLPQHKVEILRITSKPGHTIQRKLSVYTLLIHSILNNEKEFEAFFSMIFKEYVQRSWNKESILETLDKCFPGYKNKFINHLLADPNRLERCIKSDRELKGIAFYFPKITALQGKTIAEVLKEVRKSFAEIRKNAQLLAQAMRNNSGPFSSLPRGLLVKIAANTKDDVIYNEKEAEAIANNNFGRPSKS